MRTTAEDGTAASSGAHSGTTGKTHTAPATDATDATDAGAEASARFRMRPAGAALRHNPHVDAGWWPRSTNLAAELAPLLRAAETIGFHARRVRYRLGDAWTTPPRQVFAADRFVKVSGYHNHRRDMITLLDEAAHERLEIMVIPPDSSPAVAERALSIVASDSDPALGEEIIVRAKTITARQDDDKPEMTPRARSHTSTAPFNREAPVL